MLKIRGKLQTPHAHRSIAFLHLSVYNLQGCDVEEGPHLAVVSVSITLKVNELRCVQIGLFNNDRQ